MWREKGSCTFRRRLVLSVAVALAPQTLKNYALAFAASAIVANALIGERGLLEIVRAREEPRALAQNVAALRVENATLRVEAQRLRSDPATIESIARRQLGLARPDERVVVLAQRPR